MCAEGMVGGAICQFSFWGFFPQVCDSFWSIGHGLNPRVTKMTMRTTRMNDSIRTLWVVAIFSRDRGAERAPLPQDCTREDSRKD